MNGGYSSSQRAGGSLPAPGIWRAIAGFIVWSSAFVVLYVGHAVGCIYVPSNVSASAVSTTLGILWLVHLLACAALAWGSGRYWMRVRHTPRNSPPGRFMWRVTVLIDLSAFGAVAITGLPILAFPACTA